MPRSAIIWTRSRKLSLNVMYHLTHRMMISWSKCRPLNRSCAEVGSVIPAVIAGYRSFQQFAPEPSRGGGGDREVQIRGLVALIFEGCLTLNEVRVEESKRSGGLS